jgi:hypothetical protein
VQFFNSWLSLIWAYNSYSPLNLELQYASKRLRNHGASGGEPETQDHAEHRAPAGGSDGTRV